MKRSPREGKGKNGLTQSYQSQQSFLVPAPLGFVLRTNLFREG